MSENGNEQQHEQRTNLRALSPDETARFWLEEGAEARRKREEEKAANEELKKSTN